MSGFEEPGALQNQWRADASSSQDDDIRFDIDAPPAPLATHAPDLAALLSRQVLGPLSVLRPSERERILRTVSAYIAGGGSIAGAADELHYHRNTIINHLRRFERQTGRSLREPKDLAEIVLALEAERLAG